MTVNRRIPRLIGLFAIAIGFAISCAFDDTLRAYLDTRFWLPFAKHTQTLERPGIKRIDVPYAGMNRNPNDPSLRVLSLAYRGQCETEPKPNSCNPAMQQQALTAILANPKAASLDKEEARLIVAKIEMRHSEHDPTTLDDARKMLQDFLRTARSARYISEARGWLAYIYRLQGNQAAAGKIYIDELNRNGSNLSRETLLNSLKMTYGYEGGPELVSHLEEYFDTPEHAGFAIQLLTNPHWHTGSYGDDDHPESNPETYKRIKSLLASHSALFRSPSGADILAVLTMRLALREGDPPAALRIASMLPAGSAARTAPDFLWMLASAQFLTHQYAASEAPLVALFNSPVVSPSQKAAAAYALCGVYSKTGNQLEQIRYALWLRDVPRGDDLWITYPGIIGDLSIYWALSGWDLNILLDTEAPTETLAAFIDKYPAVSNIRLVKYSLAVRLARANQYAEAAEIYSGIGEKTRADRMNNLAALYQEANRTDTALADLQVAKYKLGEYIGTNPERLYFNFALWQGMQNYALSASTDSRLTVEERHGLGKKERDLRDAQEERWRAALILRDVARQAPGPEIGRKSARRARDFLVQINERFERRDDIRKVDAELIALLRR